MTQAPHGLVGHIYISEGEVARGCLAGWRRICAAAQSIGNERHNMCAALWQLARERMSGSDPCGAQGEAMLTKQAFQILIALM